MKNKILTFIILLLLINNIIAQQYVTVGSGNNNSPNIPFRSLEKFSYSASIYKSQELGSSHTFYGISYYLTNYTSTTLQNQKIYIAEVSSAVFNSTCCISHPDSIGATLVFDGAFNINNSGWNNIIFDTPFSYSGSNHIIVFYQNYNGSALNSITFKTTSTSYPRTLSRTNDNKSAFHHSAPAFDYNEVPNIRLLTSNPVVDDIALVSWISPHSLTNLGSNTSVQVKFKNKGTASQNGLSIKYSVDNGQSWVNESISGTYIPNSNTIKTFSASANMYSPGVYSMISVINNPGDTRNKNDTIRRTLVKCGSGLSGSFEVGNGNADFSSINQAISALKTCGLAGPVTLSIKPGSYEGQFDLSGISGLSSVNKLLIKSATNNADDVTLEFSTPFGTDNKLLNIYQQKNIDLKYLSFTTYSNDEHANQLLHIESSDSINVIGCKFKGFNSNALFGNRLITIDNSNYINIDSNYFKNGKDCIYSTFSNNYTKNTNLYITNNEFYDFYENGINIERPDSVFIIGNYFKNKLNWNGKNGVYIEYSDFFVEVSRNRIIDSTNQYTNFNGIYTYHCDYSNNDIRIFNNMISSFTTNTITGNKRGIYIYDSENIDVFFNSIYFNYTSTNDYRVVGIFIDGSSEITVKNNNIKLGVGYPIYYDEDYSSNNNFMDYNNLKADNYVSYIINSSYSSIASYISNTNFGNNSRSINPSFTSFDDLHISNPNINNTGTPISYINKDYDNNTRKQVNPDIGADEFPNYLRDIEMIEILSVQDTIVWGNRNIVVKFENLGNDNLTSADINWSVDGVIQPSFTWTGNMPIFSISPQVNLGVYNFINQNHTLKVWSSNPNNSNDFNLNNDTITKDIYCIIYPIYRDTLDLSGGEIQFCNDSLDIYLNVYNDGYADLNFQVDSFSSNIYYPGNQNFIVNAQDSIQLKFYCLSTGLPAGLQNANINISTNDPNHFNINNIFNIDLRNILKNFSLGNDTVLCADETLVLDAGNWQNYYWSTGSMSSTISIDSNGIGLDSVDVWVVVDDQIGCYGIDTITLSFENCNMLIDESAEYGSVKVYPNPTKSIINIDLTKIEYQQLEINVLSSDGRLIKSEIIKSNASSKIHKINLDTFSKGIYYLNLKSDDYQKTIKVVLL